MGTAILGNRAAVSVEASTETTLKGGLNVAVRQTIWHYDLDKLLLFYDLMYPYINWVRSKNGSMQSCLQYHKQPDNDGAGSFRDTGKLETDYKNVNAMYANTAFEEIMNDVGAVRSRLMNMITHTCYSVHQDKAPRYHMALDTNPDAFFVFPETEQICHIPADGYIYEVDTTRKHTFVNAGPDRTHLVMVRGDYYD